MISAFARAAQILDDAEYLARGRERRAVACKRICYDAANKTLVRNYREGRSAVEGFADDYAFVIQGLLDLYEASFDVDWLKFALDLQETLDRLFYDEKNGGYFSGTGNDPSILLRMKEDNDGAEPAASSVAALNLLRLAQIRDDDSLGERAPKTIAAFGRNLEPISQRDAADAGRARCEFEQAATNRDRGMRAKDNARAAARSASALFA